MSKPKKPTGLNAEGAALWDSITSKYVLRADEQSILESACRATDRIVLMRDQLDSMPLMLLGSTGQQVVNPLVAEIRAHEAQVAGLLAKLKLPDEAAGPQVNAQRTGGQTRWANAHGAGA